MSTESNQCCDELRELVGELALGDDAWLSGDERRVAEAHVAVCCACRRYVAHIAAIGDALRSMAEPEPEIEVPERVLLESRYRILAAVRAATVEHRQQQLESAWRRRARLGWVACAAAALMVAGIGLLLWLSRATPTEVVAPSRDASPSPVQPTSSGANTTFVGSDEPLQHPLGGSAEPKPTQPTLKDTVATVGEPEKALDLLEREFAKAKEAPTGGREVIRGVLAAAEGIAARSQGTDAELRALTFISRCHSQLADRRKAQEAFLAYADALAARARAEALAQGLAQADADARALKVIGNTGLREADRLFTAEDHLAAMSYCDALVTRYPGSDVASRALALVGQCHMRRRAPAQAAEAFQAVIRQAPGSVAARTARAFLPSSLFNSGRKTEAVQAWVDYAETATSTDAKANGYYNAAAMLAFIDKRNCPRAIRMYRTVLRKYPDARCARVVERALARLEKEIERDVLHF